MAITITKNASTGNIKITDTGKPDIRLCNHGTIFLSNNDAGTYIEIVTMDYNGHLPLSDITTIGNSTGGPFALATALSHLDDLFKK
jgi:pimeloyl-ACP methyl ester carboxylesterase